MPSQVVANTPKSIAPAARLTAKPEMNEELDRRRSGMAARSGKGPIRRASTGVPCRNASIRMMPNVSKQTEGTITDVVEQLKAKGLVDSLMITDAQGNANTQIQQIQSMMGEILNFRITNHSLNLFGKCRELEEKGSCKHRKTA